MGSKAVCQVDALKVVKMDILSNGLFDFGAIGKSHRVKACCFKGTKEMFHGGVVLGAAWVGHGKLKVVLLT